MLKMMTLVENTTVSSEYGCKHGLCIYIETPNHKILFDLGPNKLFAENALKMNVDISDIDTVIISHGHKDHGGALKYFLEQNKKAKIYIRKEAFEPHYIKVLNIPFNVGLDKTLLNQVLISGCSHAGIVNIQNRAEQIAADKMDMVVGGFHLYNPPTRKYESDEVIDSVVDLLNKKGSIYYTCHCTGPKAYKRMKAVMGNKMNYLSTGTEVVR